MKILKSFLFMICVYILISGMIFQIGDDDFQNLIFVWKMLANKKVIIFTYEE